MALAFPAPFALPAALAAPNTTANAIALDIRQNDTDQPLIQVWRDSTGAVKMSIAQDGSLVVGGLAPSSILTQLWQSPIPDAPGAVAHIADGPAYVGAGSKLLSLRNGTVEKLSIDKDGKVSTSGYTDTAVLFVGPSGEVKQNTVDFFWQDGLKRLNLRAPFSLGTLNVGGSIFAQSLVSGARCEVTATALDFTNTGADVPILLTGTSRTLEISGSAAEPTRPTFRVKGRTSQSVPAAVVQLGATPAVGAKAQRWEDSAGALLAELDSAGNWSLVGDIVWDNTSDHAFSVAASSISEDPGKDAFWTAGKGGPASVSEGGEGGDFGGYGGMGGDGTVALPGGVGGTLGFFAGDGGTDNGGGGGVGGDSQFDAGLGSGAEENGRVFVGTDNAREVRLGRGLKDTRALGYWKLSEQISDPATPAAGDAVLWLKNVAGLTQLRIKFDDGTNLLLATSIS